MIILDVKQGEPEWMAARAGIPSASMFDKIATTKGVPSTSSQKALYKLAGERIIGGKEEGYTNAAMQRGIDLEPEARVLFQLVTGFEFETVGFCCYDKRKDRGCSPDGLNLGRKEGLEIKCPELQTHVEYLLGGKLPTKYFAQVQGSLYIAGYERWHFFSYYPGMPPFHIIVERDEIWIAKFSKILDHFIAELDETYKLLKEGGSRIACGGGLDLF